MRNMFATLNSLADLDLTLLTTFKKIWLDPVNGGDQRSGKTLQEAVKTLAAAYVLATTGKNDMIMLVSNGLSTGTARVDEAFTWTKDATHLVGIATGNRISPRARIAPTAATTAFANFITVTGDGCLFRNIHINHGFTTGVAAAIAVTLNGANYNRFENVHFGGMADNASAQSATSRAVKIYNSGENEFVGCTFGVDTIARTVANCLVEFTSPAVGGAAYNPRNKFIDCDFVAWTTTAQTQLDIQGTLAGCTDRWTLFDRCRFMNSLQASGYLIQTSVATVDAANKGTLIFKDCCLVGRTGFGPDGTTRAFCRIEGGATVNNTTAISLAPNA